MKQNSSSPFDGLYQLILENPPYGYFPSTPALAQLMLAQVEVYSGMTGLEPSAGCGVLARAMRNQGVGVDVIELDPHLRHLLFQQGFNLIGSNFLAIEPAKRYDLIVMNPPFSAPERPGVDLEHIRHAYRFLRLGGQLVSVVSRSMDHSTCDRARQFRAFLKRTESRVIDLGLEAFWGSDRPVTVETRLVVIKKHELTL